MQPSSKPSAQPSTQPSSKPSTQPSSLPTSQPSSLPTSQPSSQPTRPPSSFPSTQPSSEPTSEPSTQPSSEPSGQPSRSPSSEPSGQPSSNPTQQPSTQPSACPSSQPTTSPTSNPTKTDIIVANLLDIPLDAEVAKEKVKYYLGAFIGYFLSIYICLYLFSFSRYGNSTASKLYTSSYQSEVHIGHSANASDGKIEVSILSDLYNKNSLVNKTIEMEKELKLIKQSASPNSKSYSTPSLDGEGKYSKGYREYMQQQRTQLGCSPFLCPDGLSVKLPFTNMGINLPPGRIENMLLFICHNHPLFSCFYFMEGSKLGSHGTRMLYIGKDVVVFVLYQFSNMLLQYLMLDGHGLGIVINLMIITPSAVFVGLVLKYLYTCPFTETVEFQRKYVKYQSILLLFGRLALIPIVLIMCVCLFLACLFSSGRRIPMIIVNYFLFVQVYGVFLALFKTILLFKDYYHLKISLYGGLTVLCVGNLYKEHIAMKQLVVDVDYAFRIKKYLFSLILVQNILSRKDAIKAKWMTADAEYDIEMEGKAAVSNTSAHRKTAKISISEIYDTSYEQTMKRDVSDLTISMGGLPVATENPMHSAVTNDVRLTYSNLYDVSSDETITQSREQITTDSMKSIRVATSRPKYDSSDQHDQPIMDARLSYSSMYDIRPNDTIMQKKLLITNDILGSMRKALRHSSQDIMVNDQERVADQRTSNDQQTSNDEDMVASKGLVISKKQFKPGTRESFITTLHKFQENEIIMGDNSTSLQNTILLHSKRVKGNVLSNTRIADPSVVITMANSATTDSNEGGDAASLKNTLLLHSKLVKGNVLLKNKGNTKPDDV